MAWIGNYQHEHRATGEDIVNTIRDVVTMDDVVGAYASDPLPRSHRIPCPIHNGKDYNLSYTRDRWKCFVCGESGDVISFVQSVLGLRSRWDAVKQINNDFNLNLPLDRQITKSENKELEEKRRKIKEREQKEKQLLTAYHAAIDLYTALDIIKREQAPKSPDDPVTMQYAYACRKIDGAWHEAELAAQALHDFAKEGE